MTVVEQDRIDFTMMYAIHQAGCVAASAEFPSSGVSRQVRCSL